MSTRLAVVSCVLASLSLAALAGCESSTSADPPSAPPMPQPDAGLADGGPGPSADGGEDAGPKRPSSSPLTAGASHACLLESGAVKCWGRNDVGQLGQSGLAETKTPVPVDLGGAKVTAIAAGAFHTCAITEAGKVKCWGENADGQLGLGDRARRGEQPGQMGAALPDVDLGAGRTAKAIGAGYFHTCAVLDDASVVCWGKNDIGQLGQGHTTTLGDDPAEMGDALSPIALGSGAKVRSLAVGGGHSCVLLESGAVKCWGYGADGRLGLGDTTTRGDKPGQMGDALPAVDLAGKPVAMLSGGGLHTCALFTDGGLSCWGFNRDGELGVGSASSVGGAPGQMGAALAKTDLGAPAVWVSAGYNHTCAALESGAVKCWGQNANDELGIGSADKQNRGDQPGEMGAALPPVDVGGKASFVAAGRSVSCALLEGGATKCWGPLVPPGG